MSFLTDFFSITEGSGEVAVCCPFPHYTVNKVPYYETNPSASVNTTDKVFHCMACGAGGNEAQIIQKLFGNTYLDAKRIQRCFETTEDRFEWEDTQILSQASKEKALSLGISEEVINELNLKTPIGSADQIAFPVFMYDHLVDIRIYNPGGNPKVRSRAGCPSGLIIPYDAWVDTPKNRLTLICAGEKDMAIARSNGFNAITFTGGEGTLPKILEQFRDRHIAICYDNDSAGINGAKKLALKLSEYTDYIKVVTGFHEVCSETGEDITDFFTKYGKTKADLVEYIKNTEMYVPTPEDIKTVHPTLDLLEATKPENINKMLQSNIQVVAVSEASFATPSAIIAEKYRMSGVAGADTMQAGMFKEWELNEDNVQDILHLIDNNFKEETINKNIRTLLRIPTKERCIKTNTIAKKTVFKCYVTDMFETSDKVTQPMEYTAYSVGCKLESGKKYLATYKLTPHPYKGQQLIMIITDAVQANDSVSNFKITEEVKQNLDVIKNLPGTIAERIDLCAEKVKGLLGYNGNNQLITAMDLAYHTVLQFNFGAFKNVRGYLDTIIVGESRIGKSSTAEALRNTYGLGTFTSLAGNSATIAGLVGGSNKTQSGFQTRAGIIPQNHRGLIIFEEFGKSNANVIKELTDIRSSNEVRISRVSGMVTMPAMVRMISLTNVKTTNGVIKPIASYPNGISIITELVDAAEDIARYDLIVILSDRGANTIDPLWVPETPFDEKAYRTRIRWIWSRTADQVIIDKETMLYIMKAANELNDLYDCHIKIFGTEAWKKLTRLSIAVAGYLVSTDETYENIIVKPEHVMYAINFLIGLYDNPTFKLKEYVDHQKRYTQIDEDGVALLQNIYDKHPTLVLQLEQSATATKNMLGASSGLSNDDLNKALNSLAKGLFVQFQDHNIIPTERFRLGLAKINRNTRVQRLGEVDA